MRVAALLLSLTLAGAPAYVDEIEQWRAAREQRLRAPDGWLTLIGLFWLEEGANAVGSADAARVKLPNGLPARAGVIEKHGQQVVWRPVSGATKSLKTDTSGSPDVITVGRIRLHVIERGTKFGVG